MSRLIVALFVSLTSVAALAANNALPVGMVDPDLVRMSSPTTPYPGKTDGVGFGRASSFQNEPYLVNGGSKEATGLAFYMDFTADGDGENLICLQNDGTVFDATEFAVNICTTSHGVFAAIPTSGQTLLPDMDAGSLDIAGDQTDDDGYEYVFAGPLLGERAYHVGRDPAFYVCADMMVADVSGSDEFHIGFRKPITAVASDSAWDNNESFFVIGWNGTDASQTIDIESDDDGGGTTTTAVTPTTTIADATRFEACVFVSAAGVATATFDGVAVAGTAFTFDDGEAVIPFINVTQANAAQTGEVDLYVVEGGFGDSTAQRD